VRSISFTLAPMSRDNSKIETPAASASLANVWRWWYGPRRSIRAASSLIQIAEELRAPGARSLGSPCCRDSAALVAKAAH
jgi:hypothetical protein